MAPIKSTLARSVSKLFGVNKNRDLSLRGDVQTQKESENINFCILAEINYYSRKWIQISCDIPNAGYFTVSGSGLVM